MKIIQPVRVLPEMLDAAAFNLTPDGQPLEVPTASPFLVASVATNVPETDYPAWDVATAYVVGDRVMRSHRNYEALIDNTGKSPETATSPATWLDIGPTNRWAMFDELIGTYTENPESIELSMALGAGVDSVAFFGVDAGLVTVRVIDPFRGIVFERSDQPVNTDGIENWFDYFTAVVKTREDFILTGLGAGRSSVIEVKISKPGGLAKVGALVLGKMATLGVSLYGTSVGLVDFSRKERDVFGNYVIVERGFSKRAEYDVAVQTPEISRVQRLLGQYRARPLVWVGEAQYDSTIIYGYYKDFSISISSPSISDATITVEGLN
jgi:hypothetical protein